jgi:two-component system cell cycle sensor histidine kinase/response regulator CckA
MPEGTVRAGPPWQVLAVDSLDLAVTLVVEGTLRHANPAATRLLRLSPEGSDGAPRVAGYRQFDEHGASVGPGGDPAAVALAGGGEAAATMELRWPDGRSRWVDCRATPLTDQRSAAAVVTYRQVEPPRAADTAGRGELAWLQTILDAAPVAVYAKDADGRLMMVNTAFEEMVRGHRSQLVGRRSEEVFGPEVGARLWTNDRRVVSSGRPETIVEEVPSNGEARTWAAVKVPLRTADGTTYGVAGVWSDITEQTRAYESAARLAVAMEATGDGIGTFDRDLLVTSWNTAAEKLSGFTEEQMLGRHVSALAPLALMPGDVDRVTALYETVLTGRVFEREARHRTASGEEMVLRTLLYPMHDRDGQILGGLVLGRDVTAERAAEAERLRLQHEVEHLQRLESLGQLAGGVAHDFNNLLAVINLTAEMLQSSLEPDSPQVAQTEQILAATARGVALTRKMLVFAHREPGRQVVVDLNEVVRRAEVLIEPSLGERVTRTTDLTPGPALVVGDPVQLEQVVINLALNARDAMPSGRGRLRIATSVVRVDEDSAMRRGVTLAAGEYVVMSVTDDGSGMDEQTLAHALEPFFTTKPTGQGTGLGLAMVYGVAASAGGTVLVRSLPDVGTTVDLYLPVVEGAPEAEPVRRPAPLDGRGELVLVVEDAPELRALVVAVLSRAGYRVISQADPVQALAAAMPGIPDLLVSDVVMPGMDGPSLAAELRDRHPGLRVLLMSGYSPEHALGGAASSDPLLPKPFVAEELLHAVRDVLDEPAGDALDPPAGDDLDEPAGEALDGPPGG